MPAFERIGAKRVGAQCLARGKSAEALRNFQILPPASWRHQQSGVICMLFTWYGNCPPIGESDKAGYDVQQRRRMGGPMATQLRTFGWSTWTLIFVLLILIVAMAFLAY